MTDLREIKRKATPKKRGYYSIIVQFFIIIACLLGYILYTYINHDSLIISFKKCLAFYIIYILIITGIQYLSRIINIFEEYRHLHSCYQSSILNLFMDVFYIHLVVIILVLSLVVIIICFSLHTVFIDDFNLYNFFLLIPSHLTIDFKNLLNNSPMEVSHNIYKLNGLDYGSGMAHSFFTGYLQIVLPHTGTETRGIKELMQIYESTHQIQFPHYKLFILIPSSLKCPTSLIEVSNIMEVSDSLQTKTLDRAGVKNRPYRNSVYKIKSDKKKVYVCAEYATPLKTLQEVISRNHQHGNLYKKYKSDILLNFYCTLKRLIDESEECKGLCELMFYNDEYDTTDIGQLLLEKMKKMSEKNKKTC